MRPNLIIGGIEIPFVAALDMTQSYEEITEGASYLRMAGGALRYQQNWSRMRTSIEGAAWIPPGIARLVRGVPYVIKCFAPRDIQSLSNVITIPAARRTDAAPFGIAIIGDEAVATPVTSLVGNVATLQIVAGATSYKACYYPEITMMLTQPPPEQFDGADASWRWSITAEEV